MKRFVIIGLGQFGKCMLDCLVRRNLEVLVIDRSEEKIQWARDKATKAIRADALNVELFEEVLPSGIECAIVDLGDQMERSILATNYLHKLGLKHIVVEAVGAEHAEILEIVGATRIVFPEKEAAERLAGLLAGHGTLDYFPVADKFSLVEVPIPRSWVGKKLIELDLRRTYNVHVVATRTQTSDKAAEQWQFPDPDKPMHPTTLTLLAGAPKDLDRIEH